MSKAKLRAVLMNERAKQKRASGAQDFWPFLGPRMPKPLRASDANAYLFYCQLDFQMKAGHAVEVACDFIENSLGNAEHLWHEIAEYSEDAWVAIAVESKLHRFAEKTGRAIWRVAGRVVEQFDGDARKVWHGKDAAQAVDVLTKSLKIGPQLSRMCVLGLLETGYLRGNGDVKADVHVMRVLGRAVAGKAYGTGDTETVQRVLSEIQPRQKWKLDLPLYSIGRDHCFATRPTCPDCPLRELCVYASLKAGS